MEDVIRLSGILWYVMALAVTTMTATIVFEMHFQRRLRRSLTALCHPDADPAQAWIVANPGRAWMEIQNLRNAAFWFRIKFYGVWVVFLFLSIRILSSPPTQ